MTNAIRSGGATEVGGIIIQKVANPKWTKDGMYVYVDMTDQLGQTRVFAYPIDIAEQLVLSLMSGVVGSKTLLR